MDNKEREREKELSSDKKGEKERERETKKRVIFQQLFFTTLSFHNNQDWQQKMGS